MIAWLSALFAKNVIFQGGLVITILGVAFTYLKTLPGRVWLFIKTRMTYTVNVTAMKETTSEEVYDALIKAIEAATSFKRTRIFKLDSNFTYDEESNKNIYTIKYIPMYGINFIKFNGVYFVVSTSVEDNRENKQAQAFMEIRDIQLRTLNIESWKQSLRDFVALAWDKHNATFDNFIKVRRYAHRWSTAGKTIRRDLSTIFNKAIPIIRDDITDFLNQKEWYNNHQIQHQRGILLYGPPGNGKSSLIRAIATEFKFDLYVLRCSEIQKMSDTEFENCLMGVSEKAFIVIEDVDSLFREEEIDEDEDSYGQPTATLKSEEELEEVKTNRKNLIGKSTLTLSGLLNGLDGVMQTTSTRIICMTTNTIDAIDAAVLRSGRIDKKIYIGNAVRSDIAKLYKSFFPEDSDSSANEFSNNYVDGETCMAAIQDALMKEREKRRQKEKETQ